MQNNLKGMCACIYDSVFEKEEGILFRMKETSVKDRRLLINTVMSLLLPVGVDFINNTYYK